jgi:hypothetical protein
MMQVMMDTLFTNGSWMEAGSLYSLKTLLQRTNVSPTVSNSYHADADFLDLTTEVYATAAAISACELGKVSIVRLM